eukprot:COSAG01_NODE_15777_length_1300_cov_5.489592_1_plen_69_part_00
MHGPHHSAVHCTMTGTRSFPAGGGPSTFGMNVSSSTSNTMSSRGVASGAAPGGPAEMVGPLLLSARHC